MTEWIVTSSAVVLIIVALRSLLKGKISLRLQYALWALVLVRLLLPFSIVESAISVSNWLTVPAIREADAAVTDYKESINTVREQYTQLGQELPEQDLELQAQQFLYEQEYERIEREYAQTGETVPVLQIETEARQQVERISLTAMIADVLPYLWVGGMVIMAAVLLIANLHFAWKLRWSRKTVDLPGVPLKVYLTDCVATPCLFGLVRPCIYLTEEIVENEKMRSHVIAHEMSHYREKDHIWSVLRCVCLVLHWYNPLVWVAAVLSKRDAELSCDERTIRALGEESRTEYGRTLIGMTCVHRDPKALMLTATTMLGTKKALKERIKLIAKKPKAAVYTLVACLVVAAVAVGCTFTGAPGEQKGPTEDTTLTEPSAEVTVPTAEPTEPIDFGELSEEELLEQVREALEYIQNLEHYQILERRTMTPDTEEAMLAWDSARYLHTGDDWYHLLDSADSDFEFLQKNGRQFRKTTTSAIPEKDNPFLEWTETDLTEENLAVHCQIFALQWGGDRKLHWEFQGGETVEYDILSVTAEAARNRELLILELEPVGEEEQPDSYVLTFRIDSQTRQVVGVDRVVKSGESTFTEELTVTAAEPENVEKILMDFWSEATGEQNPYDREEPDPVEPIKENPLYMLDFSGMYYSGASEDYYSFVYNPDDDYMHLGEEAVKQIKSYNLQSGFLYSLRYSTGKVYPVLEERVVGLHTTERYLFSLTQANTIVVTDMIGQVKIVLHRGEKPIQMGSLGYWNGTLYFVEGNSVRNLDLTTGYAGVLTTYEGAIDADPVYNVADKYPHLLYIRTATEYIACNLLTRETAVLDTDAKLERFLEDGTWPVEQELTVEYFTQLLSSSKGYWYHRIMGSVFDRPEEISLEHTFYSGMELISVRNDAGDYNIVMNQRQDRETYTSSEIAYLKILSDERCGDPINWSNDAKFPRKRVEEILNTCLGISLEDAAIPDCWDYFVETDAFYDIVFDFYTVESKKITDVVVRSNGNIEVHWKTDWIVDTRSGEMEILHNPKMVMTLRRNNDGSFLVLSNVLE